MNLGSLKLASLDGRINIIANLYSVCFLAVAKKTSDKCVDAVLENRKKKPDCKTYLKYGPLSFTCPQAGELKK